jgi:asparagine synthase (glutamine-hydrolysing)
MSPLHFETSVGFRAPAIDRIEPDVARSVGAEAVFRGNGGDELFCRHHLSLSVADFIRHRGLGAGLFDLLTHVAVIEGDTAWRILGRALVNAFVPRRWNLAAILDDDQEGFSLLTTEVVQTLLAASTFDFPYARGTSDAAPGRLWQVSLLTARRPFYSPFMRADDPDTVSPLLSQPVIEACLRIPTHFQSIGRRDRALARTAFAQDLPPAIAGRSDKGDVEQLAGAILTRNRSFIREMLLEGLLVRERLVNRARLETALSDAPSHAFPGSAAVFELLGAEIWARAWHVRP